MTANVYKKNLLLPSIKIVLDIISLELSFIVAFHLRFYSPLTLLFPIAKGIPSFINYFYFSLYLIVVYIFLFSIFKSYSSRIILSYSQDIPLILKTSTLAIIFAMSSAFLYRDFSYSRLVFLLLFINSTFFLLITRYIYHQVKKRFIKKGV